MVEESNSRAHAKRSQPRIREVRTCRSELVRDSRRGKSIAEFTTNCVLLGTSASPAVSCLSTRTLPVYFLCIDYGKESEIRSGNWLTWCVPVADGRQTTP